MPKSAKSNGRTSKSNERASGSGDVIRGNTGVVGKIGKTGNSGQNGDEASRRHKLKKKQEKTLGPTKNKKKVGKATELGGKSEIDDFRRISLYPSSSEVLNNRDFLKTAATNVPYKDANHYLDTQFRLLREDFLRPLRIELEKRALRSRPGNEVTFSKIQLVNEHFCARLSFNPQHKIPYLKYGSLVCFTRDKFKSALFGRICESSDENLTKGELIIEFDGSTHVDFREIYSMVTYEVFFEPYFQVLKALQDMPTTHFPLEKYILRLEMEPRPPSYLSDGDYSLAGRKFRPLGPWPPEVEKSLGLDRSQFSVFKAALTREMAIVQGPPGTGKTHLGLAIVKALVENQDLWYTGGPILVVCYTNRALDKFLEGVLRYTDRVKRVGQRGTSPILKKVTVSGAFRGKNPPASEKLRQLKKTYREFDELRILEAADSLRGAVVVGMTTTTAARWRPCLQSLKIPIVVVHRASEVLEAHVVTALTEHCQHLILIGDHRQLRPQTAHFDTNGVSLLERMAVEDDVVLDTQYRMRPEISTLMSPMYPFLKDHPSVKGRPPISGIGSSVFLLDLDRMKTKTICEVHFLLHLAKYLIQNGYSPTDMTILVTCLDQLHAFQREIVNHKQLTDVKVSILLYYQEEENDIILLSLAWDDVDDVSTENWLSVALSRARNGLYITGNLTQLCKKSDLWVKIRAGLHREGHVGHTLPLQCQIHPHVVTHVRSHLDFTEKGGCTATCRKRLECGHKCKLPCHLENRDHKGFVCERRCKRALCDQEHRCRQQCHEKCHPCHYLVNRSLQCGHEVVMECHLNTNTYPCPVIVPWKLPCSHVVEKPCSQKQETCVCSVCNV